MPRPIVKSVCVLGGGTAGYLTALALRRCFPTLEVSVVSSSKIPIIGVGEATTPPFVALLHGLLGISARELRQGVAPTWKLGIRFDWGNGRFNYPFNTGAVREAYAFDGSTERASIGSLLMSANRTPIFAHADGLSSALADVHFAYHLDNAPFVRFLELRLANAGVERIDALIKGAVTRAGSGGDKEIDYLVCDDGTRLLYDFYIDCSGFRSELLGRSFETPFVDYSSSLLCDRAVTATVDHGGAVNTFTAADTFNAGWCWTIPMASENHCGYVYSSAFRSDDQAAAELRSRHPSAGETQVVKFRSGRRADFWVGNVVAIGNAYAFVEPLESTALHMATVGIRTLLRLLDADREGTEDRDRALINRRMGAHWDYLRWFLALHYRFNGRLDTDFWQVCRNECDISGLEQVVADFRDNGPLTGRWTRPDDAIFGAGGVDILLLGQGLRPKVIPPAIDRPEWERWVSDQVGAASRALPFTEAVGLLDERPDLFDHVVEAGNGWVARMASAMMDVTRTLAERDR